MSSNTSNKKNYDLKNDKISQSNVHEQDEYAHIDNINYIIKNINLFNTQNDGDHVHIDESHFFKTPKNAKGKRYYRNFGPEF